MSDEDNAHASRSAEQLAMYDDEDDRNDSDEETDSEGDSGE